MRLRFAVAALFGLSCLRPLPVIAQTANNTNPAVGRAYLGCVEGRGLRIFSGLPNCNPTGVPTLTSCGSATITTTANDYGGQITIPASLTSCVLTLTQKYQSNFICFAQSQGSNALLIGSITVNNSGTKTTLTFPITLNLSPAVFGYICTPG